MDLAAIQTLLALLLALSYPAVSLSPLEKEKLFEVGEQLELDPDDWDFICKGLNAIITSHPSLSQAFDTELMRLENVVSNIKPEFNPTQTELAEILPADKEIEERRYVEGEADYEGMEIINAAIRILKEDDPAETTKKLSWIDRIKKILSSHT